MPVYIVRGYCKSPGYATVKAKNQEEARDKAEREDFDEIFAEDDPFGFVMENDDDFEEAEQEEEETE